MVDKLTDHQPHPEILNSQRKSFPNWWFWIRLGIKIKNSKLKILVELGYWPQAKEFIGEVDEFIEN